MMVKDKIDVQVLKDRGLTCSKLKSMIKNKQEDSKKFRKVGFNTLANREEDSAKRIRLLKNKVCILK